MNDPEQKQERKKHQRCDDEEDEKSLNHPGKADDQQNMILIFC